MNTRENLLCCWILLLYSSLFPQNSKGMETPEQKDQAEKAVKNENESMIGENRTPRSSPSMSVGETQDPTMETWQKTMEERIRIEAREFSLSFVEVTIKCARNNMRLC